MAHTYYLFMFLGWLIHFTKALHFKSLGFIIIIIIDLFGYRNICLVFKLVSYSLTSFSSCDD